MMDKRIRDHIRAIDPLTSRKRVFAFMADKVTEMHRSGDAVALLIITEEGELKTVLANYLLVIGHIGEALMGRIYDDNFVNKLGLNLAKIREQCTGAAFDGAYFHLNNPHHLAKHIVENANGSQGTRSEIRNLNE